MLNKILCVIALITACAVAQAQPAPDQRPGFTLKQLGPGIYAAINPDGGRAGSNAGFIVGDDEVAVVDTLVDIAPARELLAEIRKVTDKPIKFVVNTHYHLDHTGGNALFAEAGVTIIAYRNLRAWLRTENMKFFGPTPKPEQEARVKALVEPQVTYDEAMDLYLGQRRVHLRYLQGHTGGDTVVFVPDANIVFAGDLAWNTHLPNLIDASTDKWIETLNAMLAAHPNATFVPGHGDVATPQNLREFRDYLVFLRQAVAKAQQQGKSGDALIAAVEPELKQKYGTWGFYDNFVKRNIEQTAAELSGTKKVPK